MNVYLKAAQRMLREETEFPSTCGACYYISVSAPCNAGGGYEANPFIQAFVALYRPKGASGWWLEPLGLDGRLTALCFAAAMHDTGDL